MLISFFIISCSSTVQVIKLDIRENQIFVQNQKIGIDDFEKEVNRLTKDLNNNQLRKVSFSLMMDGKSKVGIVSDLKVKMENWKKSKID